MLVGKLGYNYGKGWAARMVEVEWLIVADYAEVTNDKATVVTNANNVFTARFGEIRAISVAARLRYDSSQAGQDFQVEFDFLNLVGTSLLPVNSVRAATLYVMPPPERFTDPGYRYILSAYTFYGIPVKEQGDYLAVVRISNEIRARTSLQIKVQP